MTPFNTVKVATSTTGLLDLALGAAVTGWLDATAIPDGTLVDYTIEDIAGGNRETGSGIVSGTGTTLTRAYIDSSTNAGAKISLSGFAAVFVTVSARTIRLLETITLQQMGSL